MFASINGWANGIVVLKEGLPLSKQLIKPGTRYEIRFNFELREDTIILPHDVILDFEGGSITGGTLVFNGTKIANPKFVNTHFKGSVTNDFFDISDYGAVPGVKKDWAILINELIALENNNKSSRNAKTIHIPNGTFYIKSPIVLWAGWEAPITLEGNGNTSTICQLSDNEYILKVYECHYVKNLRLSYGKRQGLTNNRSVAVACQRAVFCLFENLTICKAYNAFGYIRLSDAKKDKLTNINEQCYVSCSFRNIRIYEFSNYAFDFEKERDGGDSGSVYDNIYVNCCDWLCATKDNISKGVIRGQNTVMVFTQLNVEGPNFSNSLIELNGMSRISVDLLHVEGVKGIKSIVKVRTQSLAMFNIIDIQHCVFSDAQYIAFAIYESGLVSVKMLALRQDCTRTRSCVKATITNNIERLNVEQKLDAPKLL